MSLKMEDRFRKKFDMDYDGMGDQGRFPSLTEQQKEINNSTVLIAAIVFFSLVFLGILINNYYI